MGNLKDPKDSLHLLLVPAKHPPLIWPANKSTVVANCEVAECIHTCVYMI